VAHKEIIDIIYILNLKIIIMTKKQTFLKNSLLGLLFISLFSFSADAQQWDTLGTALETNSSSADHNIEAYNDTIYVAYVSFFYGGKAIVKKYDGTTWQIVGTPGFSTAMTTKLDFKINSIGELYVAYRDDVNSRGITVMKYENSSWVPVGTVNISNGEATDPSLGFDAADVPYITYVAGPNFPQLDIIVKKFTGGSWSTVGPPVYSATFSSSSSQPREMDLAFSSTGVPYVAYAAGTGQGVGVKRLNTSGSWSIVGSSAIVTSPASSSPNLVFDSNDDLYLSCQDGANSFKTTVQKYSGAGWFAVGPVGFTTSSALYQEIALSSTGVPYVVQTQTTGTRNAVVYEYDGTNWNTLGGEPVIGSVEYTDMVISDDVVYIIYKQFNTSYVLKYNLTTNIHKIPTLNQDITIYPNPTKEQLTIEGVEGIELIRILTMDGKVMETITTTNNTISVEALPQGIYTIEVITTEGTGYKNFIKQ
jgi:hypothetical protein